MAALACALLVCGVATAVAAAPNHPKKKTHLAKPAPKPATKPTAPEPMVGPRPPAM
jgi:hypothetical protein